MAATEKIEEVKSPTKALGDDVPTKLLGDAPDKNLGGDNGYEIAPSARLINCEP